MEDVAISTFIELGRLNADRQFESFGLDLIEVNHFNYAFIKGIDGQGKVQTDLRGGNMSFNADLIPPEILLEWALLSNKYFSGIIHYRDFRGHPVSKVYFENAACVHFKINYCNEGGGYFNIHCGLQAESITLGSARTFLNSWTNFADMDTYTGVSATKSKAKDSIKAIAKKYALTEAGVTGYLDMFGKRYELGSFEMEFVQQVDYKGEPRSSVRGGVANITLFQLPDENLSEWIMRPEGHKGLFVFGDIMRGYDLKIACDDARCINFYAETNNGSGNNVETRINIAPKSLVFQDTIKFNAFR